MFFTVAILWVAGQYRSDAQWVDHTHEVISAIGDVDALLARAESSARAYAVTRDSSRITEFKDARDRTEAAAGKLLDLTRDNSSQHTRIQQFNQLLTERLNFLERSIGLIQSGSSPVELAAIQSAQGRSLAAATTQQLLELRREEDRLLNARVAARSQKDWILVILCGSLMLAGVAVAFRGNQMILRYRDLRDQAEDRLRIANEQLESRVQERTRDLERSNTDLRQFTFAASHDFNEPLRTIGIYTDLLRQRYSDRLDGNGREVLGFISKGVARMAALLAGLRTYLEISTNSSELAHLIDLRGSLDAVLMDLDPAIEANGACIDAGALPTVRMHPLHARQLFHNLIGNALKYRGASPPVISISSELDGDYWKITVSDNGLGIDKIYQDQIFGLFKRLHTADEIPGSGLGLAICRTIVHQYGGEIWVESTLGKGSKFYFTLPAERIRTNYHKDCAQPSAGRPAPIRSAE